MSCKGAPGDFLSKRGDGKKSQGGSQDLAPIEAALALRDVGQKTSLEVGMTNEQEIQETGIAIDA